MRVAGCHGAGGGVDEGADRGSGKRGGEEIARAVDGHLFEGGAGGGESGGARGMDDYGGPDLSDEDVQVGGGCDVPSMILYIGKKVASRMTAEDGDRDEVGCAKEVLDDVHADESAAAND